MVMIQATATGHHVPPYAPQQAGSCCAGRMPRWIDWMGSSPRGAWRLLLLVLGAAGCGRRRLARRIHARSGFATVRARTFERHKLDLVHYSTTPSRLPIADWENFAARRVESVWLAETGAAPENRVFLRTGKI
jgi:hypothetical protein